MTDAVRPTNPPPGYTSLTPYLVVDGAARAFDFYTAAFGATLVSRNDAPDGTVAHAELQFTSGRLQLSDPLPDMYLVPPDGTNTANHSSLLYCDDVYRVWRSAGDAGATPFAEPSAGRSTPASVDVRTRPEGRGSSGGSVAFVQAATRRL